MLGWFSAIVTGDDLPPDAVAQDSYSRAISQLSVAPGNAMAIDDSDAGVTAASRAGLKVVATPGIYTSSGAFRAARVVLSDLGQPSQPFDIIQGPDLPFSFITVESLKTLASDVCFAEWAT